ncbi:benzoate/H(+) symporter BenE family transporter [Arsenicicoccus sp. oral taxon 190]|uniref:benzoate/H(+) symporter BenE family transporter n=1 Tax=Arsenicicoccus sp. oral taxon 190 TaxID=1658671 RepID=UPI00067A42F0|nr:benzoate/H(+) symporter BenE family transporter [Arsenicicoccus sp. oral taxon 190]AKT52428.1 benzoate transporter [Arsenicicoccus sp. oral taxon 190]
MSTAATTPARPDLRRDASASAVVAGFIAVAISYAGPLLVVLEAARAGGLSPQLTPSWVWAISVGSGLVCLVMSWVTKQPVMVAWSIPGAALLITSLGVYRFSDAVGAYVVCGVASVVLGATGLIGRLLQLVPRPITAAVLAGVLFPFALKVAAAVAGQPIVAGGLVLGYLMGRRWQPRYAVFLALAVGGVLAVVTGQTQAMAVRLALTTPTWTTPTWSWEAILGIALPLLIVTAVGQNAPGLIVMHNSGYDADDRLLLGVSGVASVAAAPFGSHALNMAAVTAAIATSEESHPDRDRRYVAGMACGVFYVLGGFAATTIVSLFSAIPAGMLTALAGVALLSPLQASIYDTMHEGDHHRSVTEAVLITLAVTASGVQALGVVSAFWGLVAGVVAYAILRPRPR